MEELKLRHQTLNKALATLDEGIKEFAIPLPERPKAYKLMRDGVTQRFEYCIDTFWKFFKIHLEVNHAMMISSPSPNKIVRTLLNVNFITSEEADTLFLSISDRNLTSHTYDEKTAEKIYEHIPLYYQTMKNILDRLELKS